MVVCRRMNCERGCGADIVRFTPDGIGVCWRHWYADVLRRHAAGCPCPPRAYRILQVMAGTAWPREVAFIRRGLVNLPPRHKAGRVGVEPEGGHIGDRELAAILGALVQGGVLARLADGRYVWGAAAKDELAAPFVAGPTRNDGRPWDGTSG